MVKENYFTTKNIQSQSRKLIKEIAELYLRREWEFRPEVSALLVIDMQDYFLDKTSHAFIPAATGIVPQVKSLIRYFRKKKDP